MSDQILPSLIAEQRSDGLFRSRIERGGLQADDANCFVTAMVLRELRHYEARGSWHEAALDALELGAAEAPAGAYGFWPHALRPAWAAAVPADTDDTALVLTELYRHRRLSREDALRRAVRTIIPCRVDPREVETRPAWITPGCFKTWIVLDRPERANPVDCCVNANVAALFAILGARHMPGFAEAVSAIEAGLAWAGRDARRLDALTPFYPAPRWLLAALDHAVECGAEELRPAARWLGGLAPGLLAGRPGLCRDAWGKTIWHAPAFDLATAMAGMLAVPAAA